MTGHSDQLRQMRHDAGYRSARAAAQAMGVPVATYGQHESGKRTATLAQFEHYRIFFQGVQVIGECLHTPKPIPGPPELAAMVYDRIHRARHWKDAPEATRQVYREALEAVFQAFGVNLPAQAYQGPQPPSGGRQ
jgi:hypothetical protein